jgi:hypothetical protein
MPPEQKRKPRLNVTPYKPRKPVEKPRDVPKSSAIPIKPKRRNNLTLFDWLTVFQYIDKHKETPQEGIVAYFRAQNEGQLIFDQSTLSRKLKIRHQLEACTNEHANALSSKRPRIVTRPDVDHALVLWVKHMEEKGETVNGPMLMTKRHRFEDLFNVPENERLRGDAWLPSFCKAHKMKEHQRHGEAGSVDLHAVTIERERIRKFLLQFKPKDIFNFDETGLFAL